MTVVATVFALALPTSAQGRRPGGSGSHGGGGHQSTSVQHSSPSRPSVDRSSSSSSPRVDRSSSSSPRVDRPASTPRSDRSYSTSPRVDRSSSTSVDRNTRGNMRPSSDNNRPQVNSGNHGSGNHGGNRPGGDRPGGNKPSGSYNNNPNIKAGNSGPEARNFDNNRRSNMQPRNDGNNRPGGDKPGGDKPGKPGGDKPGSGMNPGNGNHGGNHGGGYRPGDHGNRPGNGGYRPGDHGNRPGNSGYRPGNGSRPRPSHGGINHGGPRPNYDHYRWHSSFRPRHHDRWYDYYRYNRWSWLYPIAPPYRQWRPRIVWYYRPIIPTGYRYYASAPIISGVLGIEFGTYLDATLNYLYYNGYEIDGYQDNVVYLRDVNMMGYSWPDVMLQYDSNGGMCYAEFVTSASYQDDYRFRSLYNSLCNTFGTPINNGRGYYSWYGNNGSGFVNLNNVYENGRYFTVLTFGV